ncbi:COFACTOR ASSEMBLY OF COMPLEX C SUBUNIT B protein [Nymphaea thermarum]|nr:COFACTOR ASSEMBLY OF COMPLEX C SUBUNIT B protein [Nymphaea thermarum]
MALLCPRIPSTTAPNNAQFSGGGSNLLRLPHFHRLRPSTHHGLFCCSTTANTRHSNRRHHPTAQKRTPKITQSRISKFSHVIGLMGVMAPGCFQPGPARASAMSHFEADTMLENLQLLALADLDPATAKLGITIIGPLLSAFGFLFILRIVMSWYPKLPVGKFPYVIAYAPTEPILRQTRKLIPPVGGVDVTPVVWFGLLSFLNEILVGPQGLLVLLSQQM